MYYWNFLCHASTGFLPTIIIFELWHSAYKITITWEVGEIVKVLRSSWGAGTQKCSTSTVLIALKIQKKLSRWREVFDPEVGKYLTFCVCCPFLSLWAVSCCCRIHDTFMKDLCYTWNKKGVFVASFLIFWTFKLFSYSFYLYQFSLGGVHNSM